MNNEKLYTNRLITESSPYLQLHAHNPVDWYPWGAEAFKKAASENKLMIISIGYSACHWCHVMEKEAFSNPAAARLMNEHYVSVMAHNLLALGNFMYKEDYIHHAENMLSRVRENLVGSGPHFANWARLYLFLAETPYEVVILGDKFRELQQELLGRYIPDIFLTGRSEEGNLWLYRNKLIKKQTTIYVCRNKTCALPVTDLQSAVDQLKHFKPEKISKNTNL
jgi:uncharacterized protein YyaL (SSP411 family)